MLKEVFAPHLNKNIKFGRKTPAAIGPHLKLRNYLRGNLPNPPASLDLSGPAMSVMRNVEDNDQLGDCVIACKTHIDGIWTGNGGSLVAATDSQVIAQYSAIGGYVPGNPNTDQGCDLQTAMNWWVANAGPTGHKVSAWLGVDPTNPQELMAALYLFENLFPGVGLPDAWINPFPSGDGYIWGVNGSADPNNGHCFQPYGYDSTNGLRINSWGLFGWWPFDSVAEYASSKSGGELYVLLSTDILIKGQQKAPNGVDWSSLIADWDAIGGNLPVPTPPAPVPVPVPPTPAPGVSVTLEQAEAWAVAGIEKGLGLQTKHQAETYAKAGLAASWPKS